MRFKLFGGPLKLKEGVLPRYFDCQPDRQRAAKPIPRKSYEKLKHKVAIAEIMNQIDEQKNVHEKTPKEVHNSLTIDTFKENNESELCTKRNTSLTDRQPLTALNNLSVNDNTRNEYTHVIYTEPSTVLEESENEYNAKENTHAMYGRPINVLKCQQLNEYSNSKNASTPKKFFSKSIQVSIRPPFRSVGVMVKSKTSDKCTSTIDLEADTSKPKINHTFPVKNLKQLDADLASLSVTDTSTSKVHSEYKPSSGELQDNEECDVQMKRNSSNVTMYFIGTDPKRYIGIPLEWLWLIQNLSTVTDISTDDIKLTLMKIKLNDTFVRLGNQFGMSCTEAGKVFTSTVLKLAEVMKTFIYFPEKQTVIKALPIQFRANYYHVRAIIDAFEIEIQKPSNSSHQALTWSEYKKGNTLKYLISCSPDGFINFISFGYGGRISDTYLYKISQLEEKLPMKCTVMADRGFKHIDTLLSAKQCRLVRPPSKSANTKFTKAESKETKRIASLRIHVERVIGRIREFELLTPHARLHHSIMPYIDSAVIVVAGLVNLQSLIIKQ